MPKIIFALLISLTARAGVIDFCIRILGVQDDPAEFDQVSTAWIESKIKQLLIKKEWAKLTNSEANDLNRLGLALKLRRGK